MVAGWNTSLSLLGLLLEAGSGSSGALEICSPQSGAASVGEGEEDACDGDLHEVMISCCVH